jgi:fumarate reductase subunit C
MGSWPFLKFILREISSVFVATAVVGTLFQISALEEGPDAYRILERVLAHPLMILLNIVVFLFILFHAVTWFNLAPKAMTVRLAGKKIPAAAIAGGNYAAWLVASVVIAWIILGN